jgi:hypothetical protein
VLGNNAMMPVTLWQKMANTFAKLKPIFVILHFCQLAKKWH